jgi:diacylglycerol kinase
LADGLDIASAAVLLSAAGAALCGLLILVPRVLGLFQ